MSVQPAFFGAGAMPLFGWVHAPEEPVRHDLGIVLCSPWGREEVSAHHSIRQWALQLGEAGWPCIRFDYIGEGDSAGDPLQDGGLEAWIDNVRLAADELKARTGVSRLCFLGIRSGAAIAALAAQGRDDVLAMIAVAPVVKGRGYVRELTALYAATSKHPVDPAVTGIFQSGGFAMTTATRDALSAIDLTQLPDAPAAHVLILDRDDLPSGGAWSKSLEARSIDVQHQPLPGYVGMMSDPHNAVAPQAMIDASLSWLDRAIKPLLVPVGVRPALATSTLASASTTDSVAQALLPVPGLPGVMVREQTVVVPGEGVGIFGVLSTHPADSARTGQAILLLNAGSTRRIGSSRMSVDLARRWAAQGHVVLRVDLAGVGDSTVRPGRALNMSYPHEAMLDVKAALRHLSRLAGVQQVHACGLCSGAYHALKAARDGMPFASITLINPLVYFNAEGITLKDELELSPQKVHSATAGYKESVVSLEKWVKLLKGQVKVRVLVRVVAKRLGMVLGAKLREVARLLHWPLKDDLGTELRRLTGQGVRVRFVFAQGDPGEIMLRDQAGSVTGTLQRRGLLDVRIFPKADHVFTDFALRRDMLAYLDQIMVQPVPASAAARPVTAQQPAATLTS